MRLYILGTKAWNSKFCAENGDTIYETRSPKKLFGRTTTVSRIDDRYGHSKSLGKSYLAQFAWKTFRSGRLRFDNKEVRTRSFFKKQGWGLHGRDRVFEIGDYQFRWKLGSGVPETVVARYHPMTLSTRASKPYLEILPGWKNFADDIVVSFVYIEKLVEDD
ncbi:hypothetical protein H0H93_014985 [Arthromyces matolae]|nr:hypothetical protein H0H93_014985 [Arthromyces matolae]